MEPPLRINPAPTSHAMAMVGRSRRLRFPIILQFLLFMSLFVPADKRPSVIVPGIRSPQELDFGGQVIGSGRLPYFLPRSDGAEVQKDRNDSE